MNSGQGAKWVLLAAMSAAALLAAGVAAMAQGPKAENGVRAPRQEAMAESGSGVKPLLQETKQGTKRATNETQKAHVLVLGTFHMANPGHDIFNLQVDDVLAPKRQKEMAETVAALKRFRPNKIALEASFGTDKMMKNYQAYLEGKYELTRNERDQLGLRLAKELGQKQVYSIDVDGDFPFDKVQEYAKRSGKQRALDQYMAAYPKVIEKESKTLKEGTVSDLLLLLNSEESVRGDQESYMDFAEFADGKEYPGPDLLAEWYRRNARIFANLRSIIASPEDRVLVIYGAGHLYWLRRDVLDSRDLVLERFGDYAEAGKAR